jgi:Domain of unknown function (DUF1906)
VTKGVDYAWERPDPKVLYAQGIRFVSRYISWNTDGKNLTHDEARKLSDAGLMVVCNWEFAATEAAQGYQRGMTNAREAIRQAAACGMPYGRPIYFSVDFAPSDAQWPDVIAYFAGIRSVIPVRQIGVYGGYDTIVRAVSGGWARWFWQTYAWSGGRWHPAAHVRQTRNHVLMAGVMLDLDDAMVTDYGQWNTRGMIGGSTVDLPDIVSALAAGTTKNGWIWDVEPVQGAHVKGRTNADVLAAIRNLPDVDARLAEHGAIMSTIATDLRELRDKPMPIVTVEAVREAVSPILREVVEDAVAAVLNTARNPAADDPAEPVE